MNTTLIIVLTAIATLAVVWSMWHKTYNAITDHESKVCRIAAIWCNIGSITLFGILYYAAEKKMFSLVDFQSLQEEWFLPMVYTFCTATIIATVAYHIVRMIHVARERRTKRKEWEELIKDLMEEHSI